MFINFGSFSKRIKKFTYQDLELSEEYKDLEFHLYQRIFYIYVIPIIPLDKYWKVKHSGTRTEAKVPDVIHKKLYKTKNRVRAPFWSYLGGFLVCFPLVLIICFLLFLLLSSVFSEITRSATNREELVEERIENDELNQVTLNFIKNPNVGDVYEFKALEMVMKKNSSGRKLGFMKEDREEYTYKVIGKNDNKIELQLVDIPAESRMDIIMKDTAIVSIEELISVSNTYKYLPLYKGILNAYNENSAEAVFAIEKVTRDNTTH